MTALQPAADAPVGAADGGDRALGRKEALRHRVVLHPDAEIEGVSADDCVAQILREAPVPRELKQFSEPWFAYKDLVACGSVAAAREKGLYRIEGKEYVVEDGDVLHFKFNV